MKPYNFIADQLHFVASRLITKKVNIMIKDVIERFAVVGVVLAVVVLGFTVNANNNQMESADGNFETTIHIYDESVS